MLALVIPYSENTISWRTYDTVVLALARLYKLMSISLHIFVLPLFGLLSCVKPHLKLLALVIPYLLNRKVRYDIVFTLGPFYINKRQFCYPCLLLSSKGDFGVKAPPQTCQQSIFGILMSNQPMGSNLLSLLT